MKPIRILFKRQAQLILLYGVLFLMVILASLFSPHFRTSENLLNILSQTAPLALVAFGQTIALLTAGVDLSVGGVVSISTTVCARLIRADSNYFPVILAVIFILVIGFGFGFVNGISRTKLKLPVFIATLCTMMIAQGLAIGILDKPGGFFPAHLLGFIGFEQGSFRLPVIYFILTAIILFIFLRYHHLGRYFYAVGGNPEAAKASGLDVDGIIIKSHVMCSTFAALGGLFLAARIQSGDPNVGTPFIMDSIIAALIGGTTFTGGKGGVVGTVAGVLILTVIKNAFNMYSVNPFYQYILKGLLFAAAIFVYSYKRR